MHPILLILLGCRPDAPAPDDDDDAGDVSDAVTVKGRTASGGQVRAWSWVAGKETTHGKVRIEADGSFTVSVPPELDGVFLEAQNDDGAVIHTSILASSGPAGGTVDAAPIDRETSLEAAVYQERLADQIGGGDVLDLRLRLDGATAGSVEVTDDQETRVDALSAGIYAAQAALDLSFASDGLDPADADWLAARASAGLDYDARLLDGEDPEVALSMLVEDLIGIAVDTGAGTQALWQAEAQAGVALRVMTDNRLLGITPLEALSVQAGRIEAEYVAKAAITAAASSRDGQLSIATRTATNRLLTAAYAADELTEMQDAWDQFATVFFGRVGQDGALVELLAGMGDGTSRAEVRAALAAAGAAADDFDYQVRIVVEDAVAGGATGLEVAEIVNLMWESYVSETRAAAALLIGEPPEVAAAVELMLLASGGFRVVD